MAPAKYASLLNRFYAAATEAMLGEDAIVDKLIGDEVMALFIPGICGANFRERAVRAAFALRQAVGYGQASGPWMPIGTGVNSGMTFVGNVGSEGVVDFTALGDTVNTASRLAASAAAGEIVLSEEFFQALADSYPDAESRTLTRRGKENPLMVRVLK